MTTKKKVIALSSLGLLPFYTDIFLNLTALHIFEVDISFSNNYSTIYGALIICFLSGMQWRKYIDKNLKSFFIIPMIPVLYLWLSFIFIPDPFFQLIVILGLLLVLLVDFTFLKDLNEKWFNKMRLIITFLAILPLTYNFFFQ